MTHKKWSRIETLFHSAMEKPNNRRETYLKDVAENDNEYTEALKLVRAAEMSADFMSTSIGLEPFTPSLTSGETMGAWQVGAVIGSGGMGEVYKVSRRAETFDQIGALKLARTKDDKYLRRFELERRLLARLEHPNIGRLIDGGQTIKGHPYMVMEYVSGKPLTTYAAEKNISKKDRLNLFSQLCRAVAHAHGRLVLHRDIKPANILAGENNQIKLIDFGVAGNIDEEGNAADAAPLTRAYAAPEQLEGQAVSVATDIYALGCVLHELLTGKRASNAQDIDGSLSEDLKAIISKSMQPKPVERYESVASLQTDIEHFQKAEPVAARAGGRGYKFSKFIARNKYASIASGLFLAAVTAGFIGTYSQMKEAQSATQIAQDAALEQEFEARTASGFRYGLQTLYGGSADAGDKIDPDILDASMLKLTEKAKVNFDGTDLDQAFLLYSMGQHFMNRYDFEKGAELLEPLLKINPKSSDILEALYMESKSDLGRCYTEIGQSEKALKIFREMKIERELYDGYLYDLGHVQDIRNLASITREDADNAESIRIIKETLNRIESIGKDNGDIEWLYNQWGVTLLQQGRLIEAIEPFEKNFELRDGDRVSSPEGLTSATNAAQFQIYFGNDGKKALEYLPRYLPFAIEEFGDDLRHGLIQTLITNAALVEKEWEVAEQASKDGLDKLIQDKEYRDGMYFSLISLRAQALTQLGRFEEARSLIKQGLEAIEQSSVKMKFPSLICTMTVTGVYINAIEIPNAQALKAYEIAASECQVKVTDHASSQLKYKNLIANMRADIELAIN